MQDLLAMSEVVLNIYINGSKIKISAENEDLSDENLENLNDNYINLVRFSFSFWIFQNGLGIFRVGFKSVQK